MQRRQLLKTTASALALSAVPAMGAAQARWPHKLVRIVVPFTPSGTTDLVARLIATELGKSLGQSVIVENKPGAGTVIGVDLVAKASADGHTMVCVANSFAANQTLVKTLPYDTHKDLTPVALMGMSEHVLATHPGSSIKTLHDLRKVAKAGPSLSYASFGNGTSAHLSGALLCQQMGIEMVHVPYKGQGPALADLLGGQVDVMFGNWSEFRGHVQNGKLIALGMATLERSVFAPQVPTLAEQGVRLESNSWQGLLVPGKTPDAVVQRINAAVNQALQAPAVTEAFAKGGIVSKAGSVQQFADFVESEIVKYADVVRRAHITLS